MKEIIGKCTHCKKSLTDKVGIKGISLICPFCKKVVNGNILK